MFRVEKLATILGASPPAATARSCTEPVPVSAVSASIAGAKNVRRAASLALADAPIRS